MKRNKRPLKYFFVSFFLFAATFIHGQPAGTLRGLVIDSTNGEALAFANVYIQEINVGATTNTKGYFTIPTLKVRKNYLVQISYVGYNTKKQLIKITSDGVTDVKFRLSPVSIELQTVEKVAERIKEENVSDVGLHRITIQDLQKIPKGVEADLIRSLQSLPGVQSVGDISSRYYVRGGNSSENLVLLDGVTLYNPFHAFGLFSVIDPEMINNVEFYKSGFPSEYGGRISSILKVTTREGNKNKFGGSGSMSFLTYKASAEGPIPQGSFLVTGRKSHSSNILKKFLNDKEVPFDFWDVSFKVNYHNPDPDFFDNSKFTLHGFFSGDKLVSDDPFKEDFNWSNSLIGFKRFQIYDTPLYSELNVSSSKFEAEVDPKKSNTRAMKNTVEDFTVRMDFTYMYDSRDELSVGAMFSSIKTRLFLMNRNAAFVDVNDMGVSISIFGKYKFLRLKDFGIDGGLRANLEAFHEGGNFFIEPRLNILYRLNEFAAVKGSWGVYQQGITTLTNENDVVPLFEPYFIIPTYLIPARSTHYNLGMSFNLGPIADLNIESYYKTMKHLPIVNDSKKSYLDADLIEAEGEAFGCEALLNIRYEPFSFSNSYTFSKVIEKVDGISYPPRYDSRHSFKSLLEFNFGAGWFASVSWTFNTGYPFTPTAGYYDKFYTSDFSVSDVFESYEPFIVLGQKNKNRLPNYHRLDFGLSKKIVIDFLKLTFDLNALNVYDRRNLFYFKRDTGERVNMLPFLVTATVKAEI